MERSNPRAIGEAYFHENMPYITSVSYNKDYHRRQDVYESVNSNCREFLQEGQTQIHVQNVQKKKKKSVNVDVHNCNIKGIITISNGEVPLIDKQTRSPLINTEIPNNPMPVLKCYRNVTEPSYKLDENIQDKSNYSTQYYRSIHSSPPPLSTKIFKPDNNFSYPIIPNRNIRHHNKIAENSSSSKYCENYQVSNNQMKERDKNNFRYQFLSKTPESSANSQFYTLSRPQKNADLNVSKSTISKQDINYIDGNYTREPAVLYADNRTSKYMNSNEQLRLEKSEKNDKKKSKRQKNNHPYHNHSFDVANRSALNDTINMINKNGNYYNVNSVSFNVPGNSLPNFPAHSFAPQSENLVSKHQHEIAIVHPYNLEKVSPTDFRIERSITTRKTNESNSVSDPLNKSYPSDIDKKLLNHIKTHKVRNRTTQISSQEAIFGGNVANEKESIDSKCYENYWVNFSQLGNKKLQKFLNNKEHMKRHKEDSITEEYIVTNRSRSPATVEGELNDIIDIMKESNIDIIK